jgi:hypothetical protein
VTVLLRFIVGSLVAVIVSFPLASLTALVFRFPIPFGGYASGGEAIVPAFYATAFYGVLGGFIVQRLLGGVAALVVRRNERHRWIQRIVASVMAASAGILTLSIWDWIIGDW